MKKILLGIDVGTTSIKLIAIDSANGSTVAKITENYPTNRPDNGWVEQDPLDWIRGISQGWIKISELIGDAELIAIGVCSQVNTHVLVDAKGNPLTQAITWKDLRCSKIAQTMDSAVTEERRFELWGGPFKIDSSFSLTRVQWWKENDPKAFAAAVAVMLPKDFVIFALTGAMVADPLSAIGVVGADGKYISKVLDFVERGHELCAPLKAFDEVAGLTNGSLNFPKNIPVAVGTMDAWGNVYGSGLLDSSHAMEIGGTSEIVAILSDKSVPTPGIISFPAIRNRYLHAGPTQAGGDALAWFAVLHSKTIEETLSAAQATDKTDSRVVFLPHLDGERAPHWNPNAQGVWIGINRATTFGELARSVLEGVAFSARQIREGCESAGGALVKSVRVSGGAARNDYWNQIKANVHGLPIHVLDEIDTGARGIALVAGGAIGLTDDLEKWADSLITISRTINPDPKKVEELERRYRIYKDTYVALQEIFERNRVK